MMQPPVIPTAIPAREDDYRVRPAAEPKSWVSDQPVEALGAARVYTHNVARFRRDEAPPVALDVEPAVSSPPHWMVMVVGAGVAGLMGALMGGFMHI